MAKKPSLEKYFVGLSKDSLIYGLGNAVLRILALLTAPIFTRVFLPAEYGIISLVASVISFLSIFFLFGLDNAIFVFFYQHKRQQKVVLSSAFWFLLIWGLLLMIICGFFAGEISNLIFKTTTYKILFELAFVTAYLTLLVNFVKVVFRLHFQAKIFALTMAINAVLVTGLMILFVVYFRQGLNGYFEGQLIGTAASVILALGLIRKDLELKVNFSRLREMVFFGAMVVPASVSFFVFDLSDRFFLNHYRGLTELGLYSIAINITGLIVFFSYAFGQAWSPQVMKIYFESKKLFLQFVPRFFDYYLIFFFALAVLISLFSPEILRIFATPKFYGASVVVPQLALAMVFSATNQVTSLGINLALKTKYLAFYTAIAAVINIILNFLLIPKYGMIGAGYATAISYLFLTLAYLFSSQRFVYLKLDWQKIIKLVLLNLFVIYLSPLIWRFGFWENFAIKILEFVILLVLLYLFGVIGKQEIGYLKKYMRKIRNPNIEIRNKS